MLKVLVVKIPTNSATDDLIRNAQGGLPKFVKTDRDVMTFPLHVLASAQSTICKRVRQSLLHLCSYPYAVNHLFNKRATHPKCYCDKVQHSDVKGTPSLFQNPPPDEFIL